MKKIKIIFVLLLFIGMILAFLMILTSNSNKNHPTNYGNIDIDEPTSESSIGDGYNYIVDGDCFQGMNIPSKGISGFNYVANRLLQENGVFDQKLKPQEIKKENELVTFKLYVGNTNSYLDVTYDITKLKLDMFYVP